MRIPVPGRWTRATNTLLAAVIAITCPAFVRAQGGIEEVQVTARKREESAQEAPVNVTALSSEQIREMDLTSLEKLASTTPKS